MDVIIGAGITGLSYALAKGDDDYVIFEKERNIGGYCKTTKRNGYVWDYSGHFFHFQNPAIRELVVQGLSESDLVEAVKNTKIKYKDWLIDYPFQKNIHQLPKDEFIDCLVDLFSVEDKPFSSFKEMLYGKFGGSIAEKFLIPYNEKLYACDLDALDKDAMGRFFPYADKEQIIRNFRAPDNSSYNSHFTYPRGGAVQYIDQIAKRLKGPNVRTEAEIASIDVRTKSVFLKGGGQVEYDRLVSTIPLPKLLELASLKHEEKVFSWNKVLVFNLGFDCKGPIEDVHWLYYPEKEYAFYRVGFYDNILRQPKTSLYVELGFGKDDTIIPDDWLGRVLDDLRKSGCISEGQNLADYETLVMDPAYVHISQSSNYAVASLKRQLEELDIYSIGRYGSWTYCSIEDNVKEAISLSERLKNR